MNNFCPLPWLSIHVDVNGDVSPCCLFSKPVGNITNLASTKDFLASSEMLKVKEQFRSGVWPSQCYQCKSLDEQGRPSKRTSDSRFFSSLFGKEITADNVDTISEDAVYSQVKLGRECNLVCATCSPFCSTSHAAKDLKQGKLSREHYIRLMDESKWASDKSKIEMLINKDTKRIDFAGGEPLLNKKLHFSVLKAVESPEEKIVQYNTNGTVRVDEPEYLEIWSKFKEVWLTISVDGINEQFEFMRAPAKFDEVMENLSYYSNLSFKLVITICFTISKLNFMGLYETYDYLIENYLSSSYQFYVNPLFFPSNMSYHNATAEERAQYLAYLESGLDKYQDSRHAPFKSTVQSLIQSLHEN